MTNLLRAKDELIRAARLHSVFQQMVDMAPTRRVMEGCSIKETNSDTQRNAIVNGIICRTSKTSPVDLELVYARTSRSGRRNVSPVSLVSAAHSCLGSIKPAGGARAVLDSSFHHNN
jgi:hypothetical protein